MSVFSATMHYLNLKNKLNFKKKKKKESLPFRSVGLFSQKQIIFPHENCDRYVVFLLLANLFLSGEHCAGQSSFLLDGILKREYMCLFNSAA
jgi:hypothetical protein